jgi:hypothetical protein
MKHLRLIAFGLLSLGLLMGGINGALSFKRAPLPKELLCPKSTSRSSPARFPSRRWRSSGLVA